MTTPRPPRRAIVILFALGGSLSAVFILSYLQKNGAHTSADLKVLARHLVLPLALIAMAVALMYKPNWLQQSPSVLFAKPDPRQHSQRETALVQRLMKAPKVTIVIEILILIVFAATLNDHTTWLFRFAKINDNIRQGEWWRLITSLFVHLDLVHLLKNGAILLLVGWIVEDLYGGGILVLLCLCSGITGNLVSLWRYPLATVGISGAAMGLVGAIATYCLNPQTDISFGMRMRWLGYVAFCAATSSVPGLGDARVDNWAHLGGFVCGALLATILEMARDRNVTNTNTNR